MNTNRNIFMRCLGTVALLITAGVVDGCASIGGGVGHGYGYGYGPGYASPWGGYDPFYMNPIYLGPPMAVRPMAAPPPNRPTTLPGRMPRHSMPPGRRR